MGTRRYDGTTKGIAEGAFKGEHTQVQIASQGRASGQVVWRVTLWVSGVTVGIGAYVCHSHRCKPEAPRRNRQEEATAQVSREVTE